jgi:four helix bundle protein
MRAEQRGRTVNEIRSIHDLDVYRLSFQAAMHVFEASKSFPKEERYSLTDQIRRSSRSVPSNIRGGFAKRRYRQVFAKHLTHALGSAEETRTWLDLALSCGYLADAPHGEISEEYDRVCAMLFKLMQQWT